MKRRPKIRLLAGLLLLFALPLPAAPAGARAEAGGFRQAESEGFGTEVRRAGASVCIPGGDVRVPAGGMEGQAPADMLAWINARRSEAGLAPLREDAVLRTAAQAHAAQLHALDRLSHRGPDGDAPLDRYREHGGTSITIGEVLGAGPGAAAVQEGWRRSPAHREVILEPAWTHAGVGRAGDTEAGTPADGEGMAVWVVMFTARRIDPLDLEADPEGGWRLSGRLLPASGREGARTPVLFSGVERLEPREWDPAAGRFLFHLPPAAGGRYHRLGYRTAGGEVRITDTFTPDHIRAR